MSTEWRSSPLVWNGVVREPAAVAATADEEEKEAGAESERAAEALQLPALEGG